MSSPRDPLPADSAVAPTQAIVRAVADHEGVDVTDVEPPAYEPLYTVVNPEALDRLFQTSPDGTIPTARVTLEYEGYEVTVHSDGRVDVSERSAVDGTLERSFDD